MKLKTGLLSLLIGMCPVLLFAQTWEIGLGAGAASYTGDLNPDHPLKFSGVAAGGFIKTNLDPYWAIGLHYTYGRIAADDAKSSNLDFQQRNLKFYTPMHEVSTQIEFNFMEYFIGGGSRNFTPYIYTGAGVLLFNPKRKLEQEVKFLRLHRTEDQTIPYRNYAVTVPYGAGFKFRLGNNLSVFSQIGFRTAFTDYLDDVSGTYHRITDGNAIRAYLANPALDQRSYGSQRGDSRKRDGYMFTQAGLSYSFLCKNCFTF